ncbi:hypothetical protein VTN96DRAFT_5476 [Rasamsonia emersonii]
MIPLHCTEYPLRTEDGGRRWGADFFSTHKEWRIVAGRQAKITRKSYPSTTETFLSCRMILSHDRSNACPKHEKQNKTNKAKRKTTKVQHNSAVWVS